MNKKNEEQKVPDKIFDLPEPDKMNINYKIATIALIVIVLILGMYFIAMPSYNKIIETRIAKLQTSNLQFLWYQDDQVRVITAQQLYLLFQQLEQEQATQ